MVTGGVLLLILDYASSVSGNAGEITRNSYGGGSRIEELEALPEGTDARIPVEVEVAERQYSGEEVQEAFQRAIRRLDSLILGDNESLDLVESNLNLVTRIPDEPMEVSWELDRYDVMNVRGEIQEEKLEKDGTIVTLSAILTYTEDETKQAEYQCAAHLFPRRLSEEEERQRDLVREIQEEEETSRSDSVFQLPKTWNGKAVAYYQKMSWRGMVLIVMGVLVGALLAALVRQNAQKSKEERKKQMMLDYPEVVNKLTLYLGAGMTMKRAWRKLAEEAGREEETRYIYEEIRRTCREMDSGITEAACYENFGRRCDIQAYIRLGALLSQNLRKGTKGMTQLLRAESAQAFEDRKANAKKLGEEAGTKLLLPMFLMLAVVLVIVIVPAFLSMQM